MERGRIESYAMISRGQTERDAELVEAARRGSRSAFRELVESNKDLVYSLAHALTSSQSQSEEIAQETFITVWKRLGQVDPPEHFRRWLFGVVRVVSRRLRYRERRRFPFSSLPLDGEIQVPSVQPSPLEHAITRQEERALSVALGRMPEIYRVPMVLFYRDRLSIENVAEALDLKENAVAKRLSLGRRLLKEQIAVLARSASARKPLSTEFTAAVIAATALGASSSAYGAEPADMTGAGRRWTFLPAGAMGVAWKVLLAGAAATMGAVVTSGSIVRHGPSPHPDGPSVVTANLSPARRAPGWSAWLTDGRADSAAAGGRRGTGPNTLLSFDFEDGAQPDVFEEGQVVPCPAPRTGGTCLTGTWNFPRPSVVLLGKHRHDSALFRYTDNLVLVFDYWISPESDRGLQLQFYNNKRSCNYMHYMPYKETRLGTWARARLRMDDFQGCGPIDDGDQIGNIWLGSSWSAGIRFYIDNIRVVVDDGSEMPDADAPALAVSED